MRAVAFDLEGTLIDVEMAHHMGHLDVAASLGLKLTLEEARNQVNGFVGGGDEAVAEALTAMTGGQVPASTILTALQSAYRTRLDSSTIKPRAGVEEFISELVRRKVPFAVGSLTPGDQALFLMRSSGLDRVVPKGMTVFREDVAHVKPHPEVFLKTARLLNVSPNEQLVFEDSPTGITAAVTAGSIAVAVPVFQDAAFLDSLWKAGAQRVYVTWETMRFDDVMDLTRKDAAVG